MLPEGAEQRKGWSRESPIASIPKLFPEAVPLGAPLRCQKEAQRTSAKEHPMVGGDLEESLEPISVVREGNGEQSGHRAQRGQRRAEHRLPLRLGFNALL